MQLPDCAVVFVKLKILCLRPNVFMVFEIKLLALLLRFKSTTKSVMAIILDVCQLQREEFIIIATYNNR